MTEVIEQWLAIVWHDLSKFTIIVGSVYLAVNVVLAALWKHRRIQQGRLTQRQLQREMVFSLLTVMIFSAMGWLVFFGPLRPFMRLYTDIATFDFGVSGYGWIYIVVSLAIVIVAHDAYFYWTHRLMHHRALYRYVHRLHHLSIKPTAATAYAFAPGEALVHALFLPIVLFLLPMHPMTVGFFMIIMIARNALGHTRVSKFSLAVSPADVCALVPPSLITTCTISMGRETTVSISHGGTD